MITGVNDGNPIMNYKAGDFFGERALLADEPRAASIAADSGESHPCNDQSVVSSSACSFCSGRLMDGCGIQT
jgi:hypothetical protein